MTDIRIVGLGIRTVTQVTREVESVLESANEILYLDTGVATRTYLERLCPQVTDLYAACYGEGEARLEAYEHAAIRVIEAALDHPPVAFAIHGHPLVAASPPFLVMRMASALELSCEVMPGISAIDTMFADLRIDPVVSGVQMYEATDLLLRRRPLQNDVPALLWQIGAIETVLHTQAVSRPERFAGLVAHLRRYYPAGHEVVAVCSASHSLMPPHVLRFAIEDVGEHADSLHHGFTLYIPPARERPVLDHQLAGQLYSREHLSRLTK